MATIALAATGGMPHFEFAMACEIFAHDPSGLRRHFHRAVGVPPDVYRRTFRSAGADR